MTPDKLREKGNRWRELGQYDLANIYNQHAAALEEIERLKGERADALLAAKVEAADSDRYQRRAERLKVHADRMRQILTIGDGGFPCRAVADYDAEFKGE